MSKLVSILRVGGVTVGTGLAGYAGIKLGDHLGEYLPHTFMLPEIIQGFTAAALGALGNTVTRKIIGKKRIPTHEAYSIAALNAFANTPNKARGLSTQQSLEEISNNLVEVLIETESNVIRGSGLMITTDGYVLTAHHVIDTLLSADASAKVKLQNGKTYNVKKQSVWYNENTDIAVVKAEIHKISSRPIKAMVDPNCVLQQGDEVRILGYRDGQKYNTMGSVTVPDHTWKKDDGQIITNLFQTDARGIQGQSGGVITNGKGELMGIVVYSTRRAGEQIGMIGGARLSNALRYINQIAAKKSAVMFI